MQWGLSQARYKGLQALSLSVSDPNPVPLDYAPFRGQATDLRQALRKDDLMAREFFDVVSSSLKNTRRNRRRLHGHFLIFVTSIPDDYARIYKEYALSTGFGKQFSANPVTFCTSSIDHLSNYYGSNAITFAFAFRNSGLKSLKPVTATKNSALFPPRSNYR